MIRVFCIVALLMLAPASAWACIPVPADAPKPAIDITAERIIKNSKGTFVGKAEVIKIEEFKNKPSLVTFKVLKQFAGKQIKEVKVPMRGDNCSEYKPVLGNIDFITPRAVSDDEVSSEWVKINFGTNEEMEDAFNKHIQTGYSQ